MPILSGKARLAGVIGWPVVHSRSPRIHGWWLQRYGIDGAYVPLPIRPEHVSSTVPALFQAGFSGLNVTIPHKVAVLSACDALDESARLAGAANTLTFRNGAVLGSNTDGYGFLESLRETGIDPTLGPVLLLGAGGAARAVAAALVTSGARVTICNRSRERATALAAALPSLDVIAWEERDSALAGHAMLVNTTSLGMSGQPPLDVELASALPDLVVVDLVYVPLETPLLARARRRGLRTVDGLGILLHQARPGFTAWFGVEPAVDEELRNFVMADLAPA